MEKDEFMKRYEEKLEKLNQDIEFTSFLTREEDIQFQLNTERLAGERQGEKRGQKLGEKKSQLKIAKKMLSKYDIKEISEITGLSLDTLKSLK